MTIAAMESLIFRLQLQLCNIRKISLKTKETENLFMEKEVKTEMFNNYLNR